MKKYMIGALALAGMVYQAQAIVVENASGTPMFLQINGKTQAPLRPGFTGGTTVAQPGIKELITYSISQEEQPTSVQAIWKAGDWLNLLKSDKPNYLTNAFTADQAGGYGFPQMADGAPNLSALRSMIMRKYTPFEKFPNDIDKITLYGPVTYGLESPGKYKIIVWPTGELSQ